MNKSFRGKISNIAIENTIYLGDEKGWSVEKGAWINKIITVRYFPEIKRLVAKYYKNGKFKCNL